MSAVTDMASRIGSALACCGEEIEPRILLRSEAVAVLFGDRMRARMCRFSDLDGIEWCLRPDLTAAILCALAEGGSAVLDRSGPGKYWYCGPAFRLQPGAPPVEFLQAGFEWFGCAGGPDADADAMAHMLEAVAGVGVTGARMRLGDAALWNALVDGLEMDDFWRQRLRRIWSGRSGVRDSLASAQRRPPRSALAGALASLPEAEAAQAIEDMFAISGGVMSGRRSAADIAATLTARGNRRPLAASACDILRGYLDIRDEARAAVDRIDAMVRAARIDISAALACFVQRLDKLEAHSASVGCEFGAEFGRGFDYYDGMVFEIVHPALPATQALARGGRYDGVVSRLALDGEKTALGAAVRPDRLAAVAAVAGAGLKTCVR